MKFVSFLQFDTEISRIVRARFESDKARIREAVQARGLFPNRAAALKRVRMAVLNLDPIGPGRQTLDLRWKPAP